MKILATTDLSDASASALRFSEGLAAEFDATLDILHVAPPDQGVVIAQAYDALKEFMNEHLENPEVHDAEVVVGDLIETICLQAPGHSMVVCGATGTSYLDAIFLGSTASRLIRECPVAVCVVPGGELEVRMNEIVVPVAFDGASRAGLAVAGSIARATGASLCLYHALDSEHPPYAPQPSDDEIVQKEEEARGRLEQLAEEEGLGELAVSFEVGRKDPAAGVRALVSLIDADLVVMGTHGRGEESMYFLGSVAERIVRQPPCAVLTVRPPER